MTVEQAKQILTTVPRTPAEVAKYREALGVVAGQFGVPR